MFRILAYCGSRNPESRTLQAITLIREQLTDIAADATQWTILTPQDLTILPSDGTAHEFFTGIDHIERSGKDDSGRIKRLMEGCDYLVLGSPTYGHNVSGDLKILMDRLTYWGHLFRLANKPGMAVVAASTNGFLKVGGMLEQFLDTLGVVHDPTVYTTFPDPLDARRARQTASRIWSALNRADHVLHANERQEAMFQSYQRQYIERPDEDAEHRYWQEHGMFDCNTLQEYFRLVAQRETAEKGR